MQQCRRESVRVAEGETVVGLPVPPRQRLRNVIRVGIERYFLEPAKISGEEVVVAGIVVAPCGVLIDVGVVGLARKAQPVRRPRRGNELEEIPCHWAEPAERNLVVREGLAGQRIVHGTRRRREIALPLRACRQKLPADARVAAQAGSLIGGEKEQLVLEHRSTQSGAILIPSQRISRLGEEVPGVEHLVADEPEAGTVKLVRAPLGDHIHDRPGGVGVFGAEVAPLHAELLHRVGVRKLTAQVSVGVRVEATVHQKEDTVRAAPIDCESNTLAVPGTIRCLNHTWLQAHELCHRAAVERKLHHSLLIDQPLQSSCLGVNERGRSRHRDRFGDLADLQSNVYDQRLTHGESEALPHRALKPSLLDFQAVLSDGKQRNRVRAVEAALLCPLECCLDANQQ